MPILIIGLSLFCTPISSAQDNSSDSIFKYKKELSITDKQEKNLRDILSNLEIYLTKKTKELDVLRADLNKMVVEKADLSRIKVKLQNIARIQADATYEDIASVRAIEKDLTPEQMSRWRGMQEEFRQKAQAAQAATTGQKEAAK